MHLRVPQPRATASVDAGPATEQPSVTRTCHPCMLHACTLRAARPSVERGACLLAVHACMRAAQCARASKWARPQPSVCQRDLTSTHVHTRRRGVGGNLVPCRPLCSPASLRLDSLLSCPPARPPLSLPACLPPPLLLCHSYTVGLDTAHWLYHHLGPGANGWKDALLGLHKKHNCTAFNAHDFRFPGGAGRIDALTDTPVTEFFFDL